MEQQGQYLTSFQRQLLLKKLDTEIGSVYRRRIEIMLLADAGKSQTQICTEVGCAQETARYWIAIAQTGLAHRWHEHPMGRPKAINEEYIERLRELVSYSPRDCGYAFSSWTAQWLSKHLAKEFGIEVSDRHINRLLKKMGLSTRQKRTIIGSITKNTNGDVTNSPRPSDMREDPTVCYLAASRS